MAEPTANTVREYVVAELQPLTPDSWKWIGEQRMPTNITATTVVVKHTEMEPLAEAPVSHVRHTLTLTVASPLTDQGKAEDDLDESVTDLTMALDGHKYINWTKAAKVLIAPELPYIGWDITVTHITKKKGA